jgi:hypothetical protein
MGGNQPSLELFSPSLKRFFQKKCVRERLRRERCLRKAPKIVALERYVTERRKYQGLKRRPCERRSASLGLASLRNLFPIFGVQEIS